MATPQRIILAVGDRLLELGPGESRARPLLSTGGLLPTRVAARWRPLARLLRLGVHHAVMVTEELLLAVVGRSLVWIDLEDLAVLERTPLGDRGRPLLLAVRDGDVLFGEYTTEPGSRPRCRIWHASASDRRWSSCAAVEGVRHIHGVFFDEFADCFWVTTGDADAESRLIRYDLDFRNGTEILAGSQQTRFVAPIFTRTHLLLATDAPDSRNHIYRYSRVGGGLEAVQDLPGPVYFGGVTGGVHHLSTVVERNPGAGESAAAELWTSLDGNSWWCARRFEADRLPRRLFQYAQLRFPTGPGDGENLIFTEISTLADYRLHRISLDEFRGQTPAAKLES